ncbi:hypothetical protein KYC5002_33455 [Archangium violaceum]|uniref:hypothetical protein n=1 Tax=Archangium violaceum TaxID=83451 RepID=UPI002B2EE36D|nr:hypothetical protein KYC5002_33455 [Archangium gephyra]
MIEALEAGEQPSLARFGGLDAMLQASAELAASPMMPEFLRMALDCLKEEDKSKVQGLAEFTCRCLEGSRDGFGWTEAVDLLDTARPLPVWVEERCFSRFLVLAADRSAESIARASALDGALRWAAEDRKRQLRLLLTLLDVAADDDPGFLARAAKIMGVTYSHWGESELLSRLRTLTELSGVSDEAAFELGMAKLGDGLSAENQQTATSSFEAAGYWFDRAAHAREQRPDAQAYARCLEMLIAFSRGEGLDRLEHVASALLVDAFQLHAWHARPDSPSWLGARHAEATSWALMALSLKTLAGHLDALSWWEPAVVIEQHLLAAYAAGRSILKRGRASGVEVLVRPRIEGSLVQRDWQAHLLKTWLARHTENEWREEAEALSAKVDTLVSERRRGHPHEAAAARPTVAALLDQAQIPPDAKVLAMAVIADAQALHVANMAAAEEAIIQSCVEVAWSLSDYRENERGRMLFNAVLAWTIRFVASRLDLTQGDVPGLSYLFERDDGSLPHENELQADYHRLMLSNVLGTEIEVSNIGGGRADLRFAFGPERLVVEVKRESDDCSFERLERFYAAQTTDYQNVSVRFGFLLVLDQTEIRRSGTPHISTLVRPVLVVRNGETEPRCIVIVNVPGRRLRPSDLTREARRRGRN